MINVLTCSSAAWPPHRLPLSPRLLFVDRCLSHHRRVSFITTVSMFSYLLIRFLFGPWYQSPRARALQWYWRLTTRHCLSPSQPHAYTRPAKYVIAGVATGSAGRSWQQSNTHCQIIAPLSAAHLEKVEFLLSLSYFRHTRSKSSFLFVMEGPYSSWALLFAKSC
jgi:hypothetical protein